MLELRMLSRPRVMLDDEPVTDFVSDKALTLLLRLALAEGPLSRKILSGLLWGEMPAKRARGNLRVALHNVKKLFPGYVEATRKRAAFVHQKPYWIDVAAFEAAAAQQSHQSLAKAAALYEEDFLTGLYVDDAPDLEAWIRVERERLRLRLIDVLERLSRQHEQREQWAEATNVLHRLLAIEPWRERTHRQLMLLLARQEKYTAALMQYEQCRNTLDRELDLAPMKETIDLYRRLRRLRDGPRHNLPQEPTTLIGREEALHILRQRLKEPTCRLLTLHGPGGIGKTQLALALAANVRSSFLDGVFYVPLSDVEAPRHVPLAVGEAMNIAFAGSRPSTDQLLEQLAGRELLLIFDNFEQLLGGVVFIKRLLAELDDTCVLVVSCTVLNLPEECCYEVTGLALPDLSGADVQTAPAACLFLQEVKRRQHDFAIDEAEAKAIARVCRLVEGYPLALEQAASWLRILSCSELAQKLEQGLLALSGAISPTAGRRQGMKAVFEQSWDLLEDEEQAIFGRLSVFRNGFTLEGARKVAYATLQVLATLVDHSLIRFDPANGRYQIHELLRQFAAAKLDADPAVETATRDRHATFYAQFVKAQNEGVFSANDGAVLQQMQQEMGNVRAAWRHVLFHQNAILLAIFLQGFWHFHELQGLYQEGQEVFGDAVGKLSEVEDDKVQRGLGIALAYYAWFQMRTSAYQAAVNWLEQGIALLRACCPESLPGWPIFCFGFVLQLKGQYARAEELIQESIKLHHAQDNEEGVSHSKLGLSFLWLAMGKVETAQTQIERVAVRRTQRFGRRMLSNLHFVRGLCALALDDPDQAEELLKKGLLVSRRGGDRWNEALCTHYLGLVAQARGDFAAAQAQHRQALAQMETLDEKLGITFCLLGLGWAKQGMGALAASRDRFDEALAVAAVIQVPPQMLEALAGIGACFLAAGEIERGRELLAFIVSHPATAHPVRQQATMLLGGTPPAPAVPPTVEDLERVVAEYQ